MDERIEQIIAILTEYAPKVVGAILTLIIGFWVVGWITRMVRKAMQKQNIDKTIQPFFASLVNTGLKIMLLLSVAGMFGIETTSFVAIFGAMAFAVGLALQGSLGHLASGVLLLVFKPYKVGDRVEIGGGEIGVVEEIQIFNTIMSNPDNRRIIVPNGVVTSNVMTNLTGQGTLGIDLVFGIGYGDSIDKAREIILRVGKECPWVLDEPEQMVVVSELGDSSVNLMTRPFCKSEEFRQAKFYMIEHVKKAFDKEGVSIPFPQMDVHLPKPKKD